MSKLFYNNLEKGKTYDIQVFDGISGKIGKVLEKEKGSIKKNTKDTLLIEFIRPAFATVRGIEVRVDPKYSIWVDGDYEISAYRELSKDMVNDRSNKKIKATPDDDITTTITEEPSLPLVEEQIVQ